VEVLAGPTGRRKWPDDVKGQLVAKSFLPGVSVREVAERNGLMPNHLSTWRGLAKRGALVVPDLAGASFAIVILDDTALATTCLNPVKLVMGGMALRLDAKTTVHRIAELVLALKTVP
jgi:transposase